MTCGHKNWWDRLQPVNSSLLCALCVSAVNAPAPELP